LERDQSTWLLGAILLHLATLSSCRIPRRVPIGLSRGLAGGRKCKLPRPARTERKQSVLIFSKSSKKSDLTGLAIWKVLSAQTRPSVRSATVLREDSSAAAGTSSSGEKVPGESPEVLHRHNARHVSRELPSTPATSLGALSEFVIPGRLRSITRKDRPA